MVRVRSPLSRTTFPVFRRLSAQNFLPRLPNGSPVVRRASFEPVERARVDCAVQEADR